MSLRNNIDLSEVILAFERVLKIEYRDAESDAGRIILNSRQKLENAFQIQIKDDIYSLQNENMARDSVQTFLGQVTECLKQMSLLVSISLFDRKFAVNLDEVNYLGFAKDNLLVALKYLQDETLYEKRDSFIPTLKRGVSRVETSRIKRLLIVMLMLEDLGIKEGVSIISSYLYMGAV